MAKDKPNPCAATDDQFSQKIDMCLTDAVVKTGSGLLLGALTSVLFLKKRRWPLIAGMGMGVGLAWAHCEHDLNPPKFKQEKK
ncbi:MICOS complex subunit MIC10-like [Pectinophora gossypiella]|uniref:MICOS complex subunit MIC10-like n=1 Tax=Pectinophora gossypiella TaxID=13191 RepID=UPI00214E9EA8|nr:MICOS complex subunit MIC10-like [Pectinophora gossypiella]